jgi:hypothetical protein
VRLGLITDWPGTDGANSHIPLGYSPARDCWGANAAGVNETVSADDEFELVLSGSPRIDSGQWTS